MLKPEPWKTKKVYCCCCGSCSSGKCCMSAAIYRETWSLSSSHCGLIFLTYSSKSFKLCHRGTHKTKREDVGQEYEIYSKEKLPSAPTHQNKSQVQMSDRDIILNNWTLGFLNPASIPFLRKMTPNAHSFTKGKTSHSRVPKKGPLPTRGEGLLGEVYKNSTGQRPGPNKGTLSSCRPAAPRRTSSTRLSDGGVGWGWGGCLCLHPGWV